MAISTTSVRSFSQCLDDPVADADAFGLLALLEGGAAELAATRFADTDGMRELRRLVALPAPSVEDDRQFHTLVAGLGGNRRLAASVGSIRREVAPCDRHTCDHTALLDAILRSDAEDARRIAVRNVRTTHAAIVRLVTPSP